MFKSALDEEKRCLFIGCRLFFKVDVIFSRFSDGLMWFPWPQLMHLR